MASVWEAEEGDDDPADLFLATRDLPTQAVISVLLGLSAFLTFCVSIGNLEGISIC